MADSRYRHEIERFVREAFLPTRFGQTFEAKAIRLCDGGLFNCDAVSHDGTILACICTNAGKTLSGGNATPKLMKVRSDILFMLRAPAERRVIVTTCHDMHALCEKQKRIGRMPREIEFHLASIEAEMRIRLRQEHTAGAAEMGR